MTENRLSGPSAFEIEKPLLIASMISLALMAYASATGLNIYSIAAAALFTASIIWAGFYATSATAVIPRSSVGNNFSPRVVLQQTTRLAAVTMAWAAASLLLAYPVIGLKWQHGWQYGLGCAALAAAFYSYAQRLSIDTNSAAQPAAIESARKLSALFAVAIVVATAWLILSGKLATIKSDWLANDVFLAVAAAMFVLSCLCVTRARNTV